MKKLKQRKEKNNIVVINKEECVKAGIDIKKVESIARRISKAAQEARELNIIVYGGGDGSLRFYDSKVCGPLVLAQLDGSFDGGDGGSTPDEEGYLRGE